MYTQVSALIKSISAGRIYQQIIYQQVWVGQTHRGKNRLCQVVQVLVKKKYLITAYKPTWKEQVVVLCTPRASSCPSSSCRNRHRINSFTFSLHFLYECHIQVAPCTKSFWSVITSMVCWLGSHWGLSTYRTVSFSPCWLAWVGKRMLPRTWRWSDQLYGRICNYSYVVFRSRLGPWFE